MKTITCEPLGGTKPNGEPCEYSTTVATVEEAQAHFDTHASTAHADIADSIKANVPLFWDAQPEDGQA